MHHSVIWQFASARLGLYLKANMEILHLNIAKLMMVSMCWQQCKRIGI
ncbi:hypothetical protein EIKCOROL_02109 [Eikenella corrodens ATCC 23834]|uniref:Uncharacterized protein n=1 Tax=Eikenella corrodens ATCC 23834 TaxID=546274 RepID=C0DXJ8_EIKCO|nr:hypothetical protein EIKCOROL_02109 [Eikenella corrodens ATCC 23834]